MSLFFIRPNIPLYFSFKSDFICIAFFFVVAFLPLLLFLGSFLLIRVVLDFLLFLRLCFVAFGVCILVEFLLEIFEAWILWLDDFLNTLSNWILVVYTVWILLAKDDELYFVFFNKATFFDASTFFNWDLTGIFDSLIVFKAFLVFVIVFRNGETGSSGYKGASG